MTSAKPHSQVLVDLSTLSVLSQQTSQNSHPSQPLDFGGHSSLGGTPSLTGTGVSTESLSGVELPCSGSRVDDGGFDDAGKESADGDKRLSMTHM